IFGSQSIENEAAMVARVKSYKAGFVPSDSNLPPSATLRDVLELKARNGHSTVAITADGTNQGRLLGIVTSRDYRVSRMDPDTKVSEFMTPFDRLVTAPAQGHFHGQGGELIELAEILSVPAHAHGEGGGLARGVDHLVDLVHDVEFFLQKLGHILLVKEKDELVPVGAAEKAVGGSGPL
uniref:CBS domain-containing protein n=1 Tax=uncultured Oscillibacter sp. TaxID=876091 RepID=UPI0025F5E867